MRLRFTLGLVLGLMSWETAVLAHGVTVEHRQVSNVEIQARFDSGEPLANAQVLVYAPEDPTEAWERGTTDDQGRFSFAPDLTQPGNWEVVVRQAGHGELTTIPVGALAPADGSGARVGAEPAANSLISPSTTLSPVQRGITIGSVVWGCVGTALFFARGKR
ncbi:MAG: carboxypeptidase-like regulatory domain-containing protein [Cyanobacteria bacterium J06638_6]